MNSIPEAQADIVRANLTDSPFNRIFPVRPRGRLVRHYLLASVVLIGGGLIASGSLEVYFRYQESREQLLTLQREITNAAAFKIENFILEIERTIKGVTKSREIALHGLSSGYRFELERLLLITPAITSAVAFDNDGVRRGEASRIDMISRGNKRGAAPPDALVNARHGRSFFGPVYFVRGSEPYMTVAVPIERYAGEVIGVLLAEVNLKYVWDVVSAIRVGKAGYAYAVTRAGNLIAHPDMSLVLQGRNLSQLKQVQAAFEPRTAKPAAVVTENLRRERVLSSAALIPALGWAVIIERPLAEAYEPLYATIFRTSGLFMVGLIVALLASLFLANRVVRPLQTLRRGAERIGGGDLGFRLDIKSGDEIEILAGEFNKMTAALQDAYSGLERKIEERTHELAMVNQRLDEASRHKSQFLASVSHELRTPLNAIIGFTRLVLRKTDGQIPALQRENLQKVLISAEDLLRLINGLLDLAKIEAGRMEVYAAPFQLDALIAEAFASIEPNLKDDRVQLTAQVDPDMPALITDREKVKEIVLNLLSNAANFTEQGAITISAAHADGVLKLAVSDTGIGIRPEGLECIFDEFRQIDMPSARRHGGTGLGLAIVKKLVTLLGGEITVQSEVGRGTRFSVSLPVVWQTKSVSGQHGTQENPGN
ncbi:MAG: HAMP domain-containing protein [Betaproteobacteria bacterium]|nr:HAMP domain-containing protein [Betaproteobacteria bacterium]